MTPAAATADAVPPPTRDERTPLLSRSIDDEAEPSQEENVDLKYTSVTAAMLRERWPVYRVLLVALLMYICSAGTYPVLVELSRALACAEYHQRFPAPSPSAAEDVCDHEWIEVRSAQTLSTIEVMGNLCATLAILVIQPRLHTWGVKRIFLAAMCMNIVDKTANLFLPLGYPYGPLADRMLVSPIWSRRLFVFFACLANSFGGVMTGVICIRLIITRISSAADRTSNLINVSLMNIVNISIAPTLIVWLGSLIPFSSVGADKVLFRTINHFRHPPSSTPVPLPSPPSPAPSPSIEPTNVAPFLIAVLFVLFTLVSGIAFLPNDQAPSEESRVETDESISSISPSPRENGKQTTMFYRLWPRKDVDGKRDWRFVLVMISAMTHLGSFYCLQILLQFFGHTFHWGQESIALVISLLGVSRIVTMTLVVPLWTAFFRRSVPRPLILRGLTVDQITALAKQSPADEPPVQSAFERQSTTEAEDDQALRGAVSTWQARVDRGVLKLSLLADILGWFMAFVFTLVGNAPMIIASVLICSFGGAGIPVRMGVDLVIVGDVLARTAEWPRKNDEARSEAQVDAFTTASPSSSDAQAHEVYFSLLGFCEGVASFLSPIVLTSLYNATLTTFPAANWLVPTALFSLTYLIHFSMPIHKHSLTVV